MTEEKVMVCCTCGEIDECHNAYCGRCHRVPHKLMTITEQKEFLKILKVKRKEIKW